MTKDEALKLALEFIENSECGTADLEARIKKALAQPEQEPVAWRWENGGEDKWLNKYIYLDNGAPDYPKECEPLYTTPPQRTWVGLIDEEYKELHLQMGPVYYYQEYGQAIEAKLKQKNGYAEEKNT